MSDLIDPQLYLVSPPRFEPAGFAASVAEALAAGPVACVQLWMPDATDTEIRPIAEQLRDIVQGAETAFLLNGHIELVDELGCDGVHLDASSPKEVKAARKRLAKDAIIGVSCAASRHAAMEAAEAGADYVSFGPVFDTSTKELPADPAALDTLRWWAEMMEIPCVAVGGITPENASNVASTGCEFLCAVSSVWSNVDGPAAAVRAFTDTLSSRRD